MEVPWLAIVGGLVGGALGGSVVRFLARRRARRLASDDLLECAVRAVAGRVNGLSEVWRHGVAVLDGTTVRFTRRGALGPRGIRPDAMPILLTIGGVMGQRQLRVREWWGVSPDFVVLIIRSGDAEVEWAVLASQATWVRTRVGIRGT